MWFVANPISNKRSSKRENKPFFVNLTIARASPNDCTCLNGIFC